MIMQKSLKIKQLNFSILQKNITILSEGLMVERCCWGA
ncbi:hypothetical protein T1E_4581 [Pseudomonas putida DOT-T1E]|uniref:Uncharacterized protein n=1 Tax=Pseudomonas putida (strain DOT-T1E) TaxID=1196325 RepID=I7BF97_PSEPT|nr:hypothetical protein T1E_4581 [Pseudomonas putida DOT-T1E]